MAGNLLVLRLGGILLSLLAATGDVPIRSLAESGKIEELRWPDASDYRKHLDAFYRERADAPAWSRDGKPTPQAQALMRLFAEADAKGVRASDYDGDRWPQHLKLLPSDPARFDVAMTATLMRYISDLHIGRVNPERVDFQLDVGPKKYDLPKLVASLVDGGIL